MWKKRQVLAKKIPTYPREMMSKILGQRNWGGGIRLESTDSPPQKWINWYKAKRENVWQNAVLHEIKQLATLRSWLNYNLVDVQVNTKYYKCVGKKNLPSAEVSVQNRNKTRTTAVLWIGRWLMAMHFRSTATYIRDNNRKKNDRGEK